MLHGGHLLSVLIFFPAVGALALMMLRGDDHKFIRAIAMVVSVAEFLFSLLLLRGVPIGSSGYQLEEFAKWIPAPPIHYHLGVDGISMFLVLLTAFLTPISVLASWKSIQHRVKDFFVMLLMLEVGVVGVFLSLDMFLFFLFWELMLIPMAFLIGIWGHERRVYAAVKFVLYTMAGSILMLVGIIWLYNATGTFDLPTLHTIYQQVVGQPGVDAADSADLAREILSALGFPEPAECHGPKQVREIIDRSEQLLLHVGADHAHVQPVRHVEGQQEPPALRPRPFERAPLGQDNGPGKNAEGQQDEQNDLGYQAGLLDQISDLATYRGCNKLSNKHRKRYGEKRLPASVY